MNSQVVILNEEQFADVIYKTVNRCLDEREINAPTPPAAEKEGPVLYCWSVCGIPFPPFSSACCSTVVYRMKKTILL